MRTVMTCAALSLALFADAAPSILLEGGYVSPVAGDVRVPLEGRETILRGKNTLLMYSVGGEPLVATLRNVGVGSYRDIVTYTLSGPGGEALAEGELARGGETEVRVDRPSAGIHRLEIDTRNNSCTVSSAVKYTCAQASQGAPLSLVYYTRRLYFFVPPDARHFTVHVSGSGPAEHVVATVLGPGDEQVARETTIGKPESTCSIGVDVAEGQDGRAWSVVLSKTPEFIIEDCGISLSGDVVPFVADHPARLAVPLISLFARRAENETQVGVRLNAGAAALAGMKARLQVSEVGNPEPLYEQTHTSPGPGEIVARVTGPELRVCTLAARLVNREDEPVLEYRRFFLAGDVAPSFADDAASAVEPLASVFARESGQQAEVDRKSVV